MKKVIISFGHLLLFSIIQYLPNLFSDKSHYDKLILYGFPNNFHLVKSYTSEEDMCGLAETDFRIENLILNVLIYLIIIFFIKFIISKRVLNNKQ
ncbi:MAG: hypothetical protein V4666_02190 [Bacteroidota bacterium]